MDQILLYLTAFIVSALGVQRHNATKVDLKAKPLNPRPLTGAKPIRLSVVDTSEIDLLIGKLKDGQDNKQTLDKLEKILLGVKEGGDDQSWDSQYQNALIHYLCLKLEDRSTDPVETKTKRVGNLDLTSTELVKDQIEKLTQGYRMKLDTFLDHAKKRIEGGFAKNAKPKGIDDPTILGKISKLQR